MKCFVIIGYGKKTSYAGGKVRVLDLDQTYELLIKPVFDELGIECYRAIDKNIVGNIDKLMLEEIRDADIALADISTLNANVMWELGVRHALRPHHTIMICEEDQMGAIPFDINHNIVHQYVHSEKGIPYNEVERFRSHLKIMVDKMLQKEPKIVDSPVHTFLDGLGPEDEVNVEMKGKSFNEVLKNAEDLKNQKQFKEAGELFANLTKLARKNISYQANLPFLIGREVLCNYKSKKPSEKASLLEAKKLLSDLNPSSSEDTEVLGLSGAIHKRLFELEKNQEDLKMAIDSYERGFFLKNDYYNGVNAAFMNEVLASNEGDLVKKENAKFRASHIAHTTLSKIDELEKEENFLEREDAIWLMLTKAELLNYKGDEEKMLDYEKKANELAIKLNNDFAISSYQEQKEKIKKLKNPGIQGPALTY